MVRIRRLDVRGFRGTRQERSLLFDDKSVLLFGENGTGKSTFVDALEKLFAGRVSTLDGRAQGVSSDRHGPHIRNGAHPTRIQVTFNDPANTIFATDSQPDTLPPQVRDYIEAARENLYVLRRRQILEFIDSQPRERYALLRPFLPLSGIDEMEAALRTAREHAENAAEQARQGLGRVVNQVRRELGLPAETQPPVEAEVVLAVSQVLDQVGQPRISETQGFDQALRGLDNALAPFGDLTRQSRIAGAARSLEQLSTALSSPAFAQLATDLEVLRALEAREARVFYEAVLEQGIHWIQEEDRTTCPLCEQQIESEQTVGRARARLESVRLLLDSRRRADRSLAGARQAIRSARERLDQAVTEIDLLTAGDRDAPKVALDTIKSALVDAGETLAADLRDLSLEAIRETARTLHADGTLCQQVTAEQARLREVLQSLPSSETARRLLSVREKIRGLRDGWAEVATVRAKVSDLEQQATVAARVHEDARAARREEVQQIFDELSDDVNRLYTALHPDEAHGGVRLEVREVGQGSVNLKADFYDRRDEDPRGYYSDAHLDTLGLSIFLALRRWYRRQQPALDLLVMDDVLTSVDVHHAARFSQILLQEFSDYQILLTTHDRIWFEHLRDIQARCRVANNFINKVIHTWSIDEGPDIREPRDGRQEIDHFISEGSAEGIAATAGRLLEHILQEMRYALRLSIQAKRGEQYEIGDLWPVFYGTIRRDYRTLYEQGQRTLDALDVRWPIRNWIGAHRNHWARNVPRTSAVDFAKAVRELFDLVYCDECRRFIAPSATPLGQLSCRCGEKLYSAAGKRAVRPKSRADLIKETDGALRDARLDTGLYLAWKRAEAGRER